MREVLLTYYHPEPHLWASPLGMPIMTKEHALQHAQEMVGKPIGVGMCLFTVKSYEIVPNEQDARYGRIFAHCSKSENAVPAVKGVQVTVPEAASIQLDDEHCISVVVGGDLADPLTPELSRAAGCRLTLAQAKRLSEVLQESCDGVNVQALIELITSYYAHMRIGEQLDEGSTDAEQEAFARGVSDLQRRAEVLVPELGDATCVCGLFVAELIGVYGRNYHFSHVANCPSCGGEKTLHVGIDRKLCIRCKRGWAVDVQGNGGTLSAQWVQIVVGPTVDELKGRALE